MVVQKEDIVRALRDAGVKDGDILLIHSSLKSFGTVSGGADTVIDAAAEAVGPEGTVVFPTLRQQNFHQAYRDWNKETTPSDVGLITETFRRRSGVLRSDQETHSVCAMGKKAEELTREHKAYGPRMGVFGDYCFSYSSPWQKMYFENAIVVFLGVSLVYNTFKHFVEYRFIEEFLQSIPDARKRCAAMAEVATFREEEPWPVGVWPFHDGMKTQQVLDRMGKVGHAHCGNSEFVSIRARDYVETMLGLFRSQPEEWLREEVCDFLHRYGSET